MGESTIGLPNDGPGKLLRTLLGEAGQPASVHSEVGVLADAYGYLDRQASANLSAGDAALTLDVPTLASAWVVQITGTFVGTLSFEATLDGTNWAGLTGVSVGAASQDSLSGTATAAGMWKGNVAGYAKFRVRMSAYTSGTAVVTVRTGSGTGATFMNGTVQTTGATLATGTGTVAALASTYAAAVPTAGNATISISGTYTMAALTQLVFEATDDPAGISSSTWFPIIGSRVDGTGVEYQTVPGLVPANTVRAWDFGIPALTALRVRVAGAALTSGAVTVRISSGSLLYDPAPSVISRPAPAGSSVLANFNGSGVNQTILAANPNRLMAMVYNDSAATVYLKFGATASTTSYTTEVPPDAYYEFPVPIYTGVVDALWGNGAGAVRVTELTA